MTQQVTNLQLAQKWWTRAELAEHLNITPRSVRRRAQIGSLEVRHLKSGHAEYRVIDQDWFRSQGGDVGGDTGGDARGDRGGDARQPWAELVEQFARIATALERIATALESGRRPAQGGEQAAPQPTPEPQAQAPEKPARAPAAAKPSRAKSLVDLLR